MPGHIVQTHRTRRGDAGIPLGTLFCDNWGETAVTAEILGLEQGGTGHESRGAQEGALGAVSPASFAGLAVSAALFAVAAALAGLRP